MRILSSIELPSPALVPAFDPKIPDRGAVRSQVVGDQSLRNEGILLQELAHQLQRGVLVSLGLDQHIEDLAFRVDGSPKVDHPAVNFQIDLVQMPSRMRPQAALSQVGRNRRSEMVHPTPNGLVSHRHSAFGQQILDVAQTESESEVEPYRLVNDLRRETIPDVAVFRHPRGYPAADTTASPGRRDKAICITMIGTACRRRLRRNSISPGIRMSRTWSGSVTL